MPLAVLGVSGSTHPSIWLESFGLMGHSNYQGAAQKLCPAKLRSRAHDFLGDRAVPLVKALIELSLTNKIEAEDLAAGLP